MPVFGPVAPTSQLTKNNVQGDPHRELDNLVNRVSNEDVGRDGESIVVAASEDAGNQLEDEVKTESEGGRDDDNESEPEDREGNHRDRTLTDEERTALESADVEPDIVSRDSCSYRQLLDAGVDADVATSLRRRFSLPWSFDADGDLDRRSTEVRGLGAAEREWVAASSDEEWQAFEGVVSRASEREDEEAVERPWPRPTPVTAVPGVSPKNADRLAEAGINSAERLATINAGEVASVLELSVLHVRTWRYNARELVD